MAGFREFQTGEVLTAANVDDFLAKQAVMKFADAAARDTALGTAVGGSNALREGMVAYLDDTNDLQVYNGTAWSGVGYRYAGTRYYTSSGTFAKADPLGTGDIGLRAIRVRCVGGGGSGGGSQVTGASEVAIAGGGGGGGYAEAFVLASSLSASETVTRGSGASGNNGANGSSGGSSSFGSFASANGGGGGVQTLASGSNDCPAGGGGAGTAGDFTARGQSGEIGFSVDPNVNAGVGGMGGASLLGAGGAGQRRFGDGNSADQGAGGGGSGSISSRSTATTRPGGNGRNGIVIVDCFV